MTHQNSNPDESSASLDHAMLVVVGVHPEAEMRDRPLGYRLRERVLRWLDEQVAADEIAQPQQPVVLTDVWYLNNAPLHALPAVAIGDPEHNAATAYLANRLPVGFVIDDTLQVHVDQEYIDLRACLWGVSTGATASAVDLFVERYLDAFLRSAHEMPIDQ